MLPPYIAMQRADIIQLQPGGLFQHRLDLRAVFAHDVGVVPAGLIHSLAHEVRLIGEKPAVERAENTESVGGEENFIRGVIAHHYLGPVHHGSHNKAEMMPPRGETVPVLYKPEPVFHVKAEELAQHGFDLGVADYLCLRMFQDQRLNRGGMVRLHVGDH